jgi:glucuronoarabinoxylan endo-1,4-beta-xylanase
MEGFWNMNRRIIFKWLSVFAVILFFCSTQFRVAAEGNIQVQIKPGQTYQVISGFGGALAFYEGWVTAHPNKSQIYDAIFRELSLDILRVRNAYGYDDSMVGKVREFAQAAEQSLGKPIDIMVSSWGPPAYLKSNNDKNNGGTIKYNVNNGKVEFNYAGFANWWNKSLDSYNTNGIYPKYISIQNEPDWKASYESCLLNPSETITSTDTIAGYNKALYAVYDSIQNRTEKPLLVGPEPVGIGYNSVENYINALDVSKIYAIAHHLYHGVDSSNPYASTTFSKVGSVHPEIPHMQTEYSLGDWFSLGGLIYKSLNDEKAVAYIYWDAVWPKSGLVSIDFPWDRNQWADPQKGYTLTKNFYAFKQFSAFIQPGLVRIGTTLNTSMVKTLAFRTPESDTAVFVAINLDTLSSINIQVSIPGFTIGQSQVYKTSSTKNCEYSGSLVDSVVTLDPCSITTIKMAISQGSSGATDLNGMNNGSAAIICHPNYPNPFSTSTTLSFSLKENQQTWLKVFDITGKTVRREPLGSLFPGEHQVTFYRNYLGSGLYFYKVENEKGESGSGRFVIKD